MPKKSLKIKKNDIVYVNAGKEKGKKGKILKIYPEQERVVVEHLSFIKRHTKPNAGNKQGGIIEKEGTIHISNVMLVCPQCGGVRVGRRILEDKSKVRYCKKCGEILDK